MKKSFKSFLPVLTLAVFSLNTVSIAVAAEGTANTSISSLVQNNEKTEAQKLRENLLNPRVVSLDVKVEKENESYIINAIGSVKNRTHKYVKNARIKVALVDTSGKHIADIAVNDIFALLPAEEKTFKTEQFIQTGTSPYDIRAVAEVTEAESTDIIEIANWFLAGNKEKLSYWDVSFSDSDFQNDTTLRNAAVNVLLNTSEDSSYFNQAVEMADNLRYTEALKSVSLNDYNAALLNLVGIRKNQKAVQLAAKLSETYRPQVLFNKASGLLEQKNYYQAVNLLRSIPPDSKFYGQAQKELTKVYFLMRTRSFMPEIPSLKAYSADQQKVVKLMEGMPETVLTNVPVKDLVTWVFPDYSYFHFDKYGKLIDYKLYPLH